MASQRHKLIFFLLISIETSSSVVRSKNKKKTPLKQIRRGICSWRPTRLPAACRFRNSPSSIPYICGGAPAPLLPSESAIFFCSKQGPQQSAREIQSPADQEETRRRTPERTPRRRIGTRGHGGGGGDGELGGLAAGDAAGAGAGAQAARARLPQLPRPRLLARDLHQRIIHVSPRPPRPRGLPTPRLLSDCSLYRRPARRAAGRAPPAAAWVVWFRRIPVGLGSIRVLGERPV